MTTLSGKPLKLLTLALNDAAKIGEWQNAAVAFIGAMRKSGTGIDAFTSPAWSAPAWSPPPVWKRGVVMPFGSHKGERLSEIPTDYLQWLSTIDLRPTLKKQVADELARRR